MKQALTFK